MQNASDSDIAPLAWMPAPWVRRACRVLQTAMVWGGFGIALVCGMVVIGIWHAGLGFLGLIGGWAFVLGAVIVHEAGHVAGARAGGMTVYGVQVGRVQIQVLRRGLRTRWGPRKQGLAGQVMAFPDPRLPFRGRMMLMCAAGPAANAVVGAAVGLLAVATWQDASSLSWMLVGFAAANGLLGLANLVPTCNPTPSDGLYLLRWYRLRDENIPELTLARLNGLSLLGTTADELPAEQVASLQGMADPGPLLHLWFVLKAHQGRLDWHQASGLQPLLDERVASLAPGLQKGLNFFISQMQCEIRFSRDMAGLGNDVALDHALDAEVDWHSPHLRKRCEALMAMRAGDRARAQRLLGEVEAMARSSVDRAMERSEARLQQAVLAL